MRLITLGDSMSTGQLPWPSLLSDMLNCDLINFARPASQNLLQIQILQDWLLDNEFNKDDIIIWQISISSGPVITVGDEHLDKIERAERLIQRKFSMSHYYLRDSSKIDKEHQRINLLSISPLYKRFKTSIDLNTEIDTLQNMLFMFLMIKRMCPQLLVVLGADWTVKKEHWDNMKLFFKEKDIHFLDKSIATWCKEKDLEFLDDQIHPTPDSFRVYTSKVLYQKLKKLNWI